MSMSELHKLGLFCLQKGKWNGRQLLNAAWNRGMYEAAGFGTVRVFVLDWKRRLLSRGWEILSAIHGAAGKRQCHYNGGRVSGQQEIDGIDRE